MKPPDGIFVHNPTSLEGKAILAANKLTLEELEKVIADSPRNAGPTIRTPIGVIAEGIVGSSLENWAPEMPNAFKDNLLFIPWVQALEILKKVPEGTTGEFLNPQSTKQ